MYQIVSIYTGEGRRIEAGRGDAMGKEDAEKALLTMQENYPGVDFEIVEAGKEISPTGLAKVAKKHEKEGCQTCP